MSRLTDLFPWASGVPKILVEFGYHEDSVRFKAIATKASSEAGKPKPNMDTVREINASYSLLIEHLNKRKRDRESARQ